MSQSITLKDNTVCPAAHGQCAFFFTSQPTR
jgi:hypothetical protein